MDDSLKKGISFGLTSGIITTLGLMVGLEAGTQSKLAVIGGVLTIAVADAFSDALGMHISEESDSSHSKIQIWTATISTFLAKFIFAISFTVPVIFLGLSTAVGVSIIWGLSWLALLSYLISDEEKEPVFKVIIEHLLIAVLVIVITHYLGHYISSVFASIPASEVL